MMLRFSSSPGTQTQTVTQTETQTHTHNERFQQDEFAMKEIIAYECEKKKQTQGTQVNLMSLY